MTNEAYTVGVIGDTHGLLREEAVQVLRGCNQIIHTGDVGKPEILAQLMQLAPTVAVRGNVDRGDWAQVLPLSETVQIGEVRFYVLHDLQTLALDPVQEGYQVVLSGHSHQPRIQERDGVLYLNPGSAGPRRFRLPVTMAQLEVRGRFVDAQLIHLLL